MCCACRRAHNIVDTRAAGAKTIYVINGVDKNQNNLCYQRDLNPCPFGMEPKSIALDQLGHDNVHFSKNHSDRHKRQLRTISSVKKIAFAKRARRGVAARAAGCRNASCRARVALNRISGHQTTSQAVATPKPVCSRASGTPRRQSCPASVSLHVFVVPLARATRRSAGGVAAGACRDTRGSRLTWPPPPSSPPSSPPSPSCGAPSRPPCRGACQRR